MLSQADARLGRPRTARRVPEAVIWVLALVSVVIQLPEIRKSMFRDDGATLYSAHLGWAELWRQSRVVDLVFLPYYAFMHVWMEVNGSIEWARVPSLLGLAATVVLVGRLGVRLGGRWCGVAAAAVAAVSPQLTQDALSARPYTLAAATTVLAVTFLFDMVDHDDSRWAWGAVGAILVTGLLHVLSLLPCLAAMAGLAMARPRWFSSRLRQLAVPAGVLAAGGVTMLVAASYQRNQISWVSKLFPSQLFDASFGAVGGTTLEDWLLLGTLVATVLAVVLWFRPWQRLDALAVASLWTFVPSVVLAVVSLHHGVYVTRYLTSSAPGFALLVGILAAQVARGPSADREWSRGRAWSLWALSVAMAGAAVWMGTALTLAETNTVREGYPPAVAFLRGTDTAAEVLALPDHSDTEAMEYYLSRGHVHVAEWPQRAQPYIEGLDLAHSPPLLRDGPASVWLFDDDSTAALSGFIKSLRGNGYVDVKKVVFVGFSLTDYVRR